MIKKFLSIFLINVLVFYQTLFYIPLAYAQEATPSAQPTSTPSPSPEILPSPTPSAPPTPTPSSEPNPIATPSPSPQPTTPPLPSPSTTPESSPTPLSSPSSSSNSSASPSATPKADKLEGDYVEGEVLVKFKEHKVDLDTFIGEVKAEIFEIVHNVERKEEIKDLNIAVVESEKSTTQLVEELAADPAVERVEPNYIVKLAATPNDANFGQQWSLHNSGQEVNGTVGTQDTDLDAPEAWDFESSDWQDVLVAVIDTGVFSTHPDLASNMWDGSSCKDESGNVISGGCPNHGWDFVNNDNNPTDDYRHGTHVAGTIAAVSNNGTGVAGISIRNNLKVMDLQVFDANGFSTVADVIQAVNFARQNGAKVINASLGFWSFSQLFKDAVAAFPGLVVTAAHNQATDNDVTPMYPCSFDLANVICVAATDQDDNLALFSNYGAASVDVGAPGVDIYSTYPDNGYAFLSGTSMATPHVAGLAALVWSRDSSLSNSQVKAIILDSGDSKASLAGKTVTGKRINAFAAFNQASTETPGIVINEFVSNSSEEWVELFNPTSQPVDLTGWKLKQLTNPSTTPQEALFANLSGAIGPQSFRVFTASELLNNTGDWIGLVNTSTEVIDQVSFGNVASPYNQNIVSNPPVGQSTGRIVDGGQNFQIFTNPTPGISNGSRFDTIYVDDDWTDSENDGGHFWGFDAFKTIQEGIDAAGIGATVNVAAGEYDEADIEVTTPNVIIQGPGTGVGIARSIVNGECGDSSPPAIFHLHADDLTLKGFEIDGQNCREYGVHIGGFSEDFRVAGVTVTQNVVYGSYYGVTISVDSSYDSGRPNIVSENDISQNEYGVYLWTASNNIIRNNDIYQNYTYGIWLDGESNNNQILNNTIRGNYNDAGIYSGGSAISNLTIIGNEITDNYAGIYLDQVTGSLEISDNTVANHSAYGIYLYSVSGATVFIGGTSDEGTAGNTVTGNGNDGGGSGIYIESIENGSVVNILGNTVSENGSANNDPGIYVGRLSDSEDTLTIQENTISKNSGRGIYISTVNKSTFTISQNIISGNTYEGLLISRIDDSTATLTQNTISQNGVDEEYPGMFFRNIRGIESTSDVTVSDNTISQNGDEGIDVFQVNNASLTIGPDNIISSNAGTGINLKLRVTGTVITGNTISGNGVESGATGIVVRSALGNEAHRNKITGNGVGVENQDEENFFDATENFWGDFSGPLHNDLNPQGQGDSVSDKVWFSPFYLDENLNTLETLELNTEDLSDFVENGIFGLPDDEEGEALVKFLTVLMQFDFEVAGVSGEEVTLPEGTRIERSDDQEFEWDDLTVSDFSEDSIQGLGADFDPEGALQWGIPNVELEFNQPITIDISVGSALNGQTLSVRRSTSGSSGWTSAGIVAPATCVVVNGICTFQATKASYFVASSTVSTPTPTPAPAAKASSSSGGGGGGGSASPPSCDDQKPGSAPFLQSAIPSLNSVTLGWSKAQDPVSYYLITYGLSKGAQQFGNPNVGGKDTTSYTISSLSGGTTYYFKVRAGNGCMPGDFSNELAVTPGGGSITGPAAGFEAGILATSTKENVGIGESTASAQSSATAQPQSKGASLPFNAKVAVVIAVLLLGGFGLLRCLGHDTSSTV